jgi:hypothetical protein
MKNEKDKFVNDLYDQFVNEAKKSKKKKEKPDFKKNPGERSVYYGFDKKKSVTRADFLPTKVLKGEEVDEGKKEKRTRKKASDNPGYRAGRNKKELKKLNRQTDKAAAGKYSKSDYEKENNRREKELTKKQKKNTPKNPFTGKIAVGESVDREKLRELLREAIIEIIDEKRKKKKKSKKKKSKAKKKTLSKKTMATLRKKAEASGYTAGSLASEYRKGLGAYYTSGSRKGMGAHQWAMARVNSAIGKGNPSWANLKRSKAKKK